MTEEELRTLYAYNNMSTREALNYLGIAQSTYYKRLNKLGIVHGKNKKVSDEEIIEACKDANSNRDAAKMLGINHEVFRKRAKKLNVYDLILNKKDKRRIYSCNDDTFDTISNESAYWLGYIVADGSIVDNTLRFTVSINDIEQLEKFKIFSNSESNINHHKSHYEDNNGIHFFDACSLKITSTKMVNDLNKYGIIQGKKYKDIDYLCYIPLAYRMDFISGLFDGDGSVGQYNNRITLTICSTFKMTSNIIDILNDNKISSSVQKRKSIDVIYIAGKSNLAKFYKLYNKGNRLSRKLNKMKDILAGMAE